MSKRSRNNRRQLTAPAEREPEIGLVAQERDVAAVPASRSWWTRPWLMAVLVAAIVAAGYSRTIDHPMVFDDRVYLEDNPLLRDSRSFGYPARFVQFANEAMKRHLDPDLSTNIILRPVSYLSFHINYIFDGMRPRYFRIVNLLIHATNGVLIYLLVLTLFARGRHDSGRYPANLPFIAGAAALLFVAHPLATESVTYIAQRMTSMVTTFYLAVLVLHLVSGLTEDSFKRGLCRVLASILCLMGMLTKESMFTAPFLAVLLDVIVHRTPWRPAVKKSWPLLIWLPVIPVLVVLTTWAQNQGALTIHDVFHLANVKDMSNPQDHYAITQITVVMHYLRMLLWPSGQTIDPDWDTYTSILHYKVLACIAGIVILVSLAWKWMRRHVDDARVTLVFCGVAWFFIAIAPSSGPFPLPDLVAEHRSYLPSIGIMIALACLLDWAQKRWISRKGPEWLSHQVLLVAVVGLTAATVSRNEIWGSRIALWEDAVSKGPDRFRAWGNLGSAFAAEGKLARAAECYQKAVEINPQFLTAHAHLGSIYYAMGEPQKALDACVAAVNANADFEKKASIRYNAAIAHLALGRLDHGEVLLKEIAQQVPGHQGAQTALARLYFHQKRQELARYHMQKAAMIAPLNGEDAELLKKLNANVEKLSATR